MKDRLIYLLNKANLKMSEEEIERYLKDWQEFQEDLKLFDNFDLKGIEPLRQPFENEENLLRDDSIVENNSEAILENASDSKDGYIFLAKKEEK